MRSIVVAEGRRRTSSTPERIRVRRFGIFGVPSREWLGTSPGPQSGVEGRGVRDDGLTSDVSRVFFNDDDDDNNKAGGEVHGGRYHRHIGFGAFQMCWQSRSQLVVRRHGDDVAVFHRPGGEVRWALTTTRASSLTSFVFLGMGFGAPVLGCSG